MKNKVVHTTTDRNGNVLVKYQDVSDGKRKVATVKYPWYFSILREDLPRARTLSLNLQVPIEHKLDPKFPDFAKIYFTYDTDRKVRDRLIIEFENHGIKTFEADLMEDRRWYIDKEIEISTEYRKLYFDIETDDSVKKIEVGRDMIVSWSAIDEKGKQYFETVEDLTPESEKKILRTFLKTIGKYDIILGWNSKRFDVPYLKARMYEHDLDTDPLYKNWRGVGHYDLWKRFRHIFRFDSNLRNFTLDFIANHFLGKRKVPRSEKIINLWKDNKEKLKAYNIEDSVLLKELDEKLGVSEMMIRQSSWCGVPPSQFGLYTIIDAHILKTAHLMGKFCRTSLRAIIERGQGERGNEDPNDTRTKKSKYVGAVVLEPQKGFYRGVHTFDFKGLYPSMMRTSNIGYDTIQNVAESQLIVNPGTTILPRKDGTIRPTYFRKDKSVINVAISELIDKRSEYKKLKLQMIEDGKNKGPLWEKVVSDEIVVKELSNSTYGIMGLEYGRYFSIDVAESITLFGQWCILFAKQFFENRGYPVIYGDTDSVFVVSGSKPFDIEEELKHFHESLHTTLKEKYNIEEIFIQLNFDKKYETLLLVDKKKYVGHVTNMEGKKTNEIYARGLEYGKKNTFSFAAEKQKSLVEYILHNEPTKDQVRSFIWKTYDEFISREFKKEELILSQRVGKDFDEYDGTAPLHVRLANEIKERTGQDFAKNEVEYIITGHTGVLQGVVPEDYKGEYNKDYYWSNLTRDSLLRVANTMYPGVDFLNPTMSLFG